MSGTTQSGARFALERTLNSEWRDEALCATHEPELFYPDPSDRAGIKFAKGICTACPVIDQCRAEAIANKEDFGVWGGLSERDRRRIHRQRNPSIQREICGTIRGYLKHIGMRERSCTRCRAAARLERQERRKEGAE